MQLFYAPDLYEGKVMLPEEEARHCIKVLRKRVGDIIEVTNGKGDLFNMQLQTNDWRNCELSFVSKQKQLIENAVELTLVVCPTKQIDRFEWFLEKATEMGIQRVIPVTTSRSERKNIKRERLERILVSAMKQSGRVHLPILDDLKPFKEVVQQLSNNAQLFIATCDGERKALQLAYKKGSNVVIFIGPEGDFTEQEVEYCKQAGCEAVSLGDARLRVETAAIAACHTINLLNE